MLRRAALLSMGFSEERSASIIRVTRFGELETTLAATSNRRTLQRNAVLTYYIHSIVKIPRENSISSQRANVVPISPILVTLMMETLRSSKTSVLTTAAPNVGFKTHRFKTSKYCCWVKCAQLETHYRRKIAAVCRFPCRSDGTEPL
jgi:hypothetical protein